MVTRVVFDLKSYLDFRKHDFRSIYPGHIKMFHISKFNADYRGRTIKYTLTNFRL